MGAMIRVNIINSTKYRTTVFSVSDLCVCSENGPLTEKSVVDGFRFSAESSR